MIIVFKPSATKQEIGAVEARIRELGYTPHEIVGVDAPQGDGVLIRAGVTHHANALNRKQHGECLLHVPVKVGPAELFGACCADVIAANVARVGGAW